MINGNCFSLKPLDYQIKKKRYRNTNMRIAYIFSLFFLAIFVSTHVHCFDSTTSPIIVHNWKRSEKLDPYGILLLTWHINDKSIIFEATVTSKGFIALGFSYPNLSVRGADVVLIWIDDSSKKGNILDCYGTSDFASLNKDDTQNFIILESHQNLTHTFVSFKRPLETCDPRDFPFSNQTLELSWGYGDKDVIPTQISNLQFNKKGSRKIHFLEPSFKKSTDANVHTWDVKIQNVTIKSNYDSVYWCKILQAPSVVKAEKRQIIGFEPILNGAQKLLVHHMTLFECSKDGFNGKPNELESWAQSKGLICNSDLSNSHSHSCITPVASWGKGSKGSFLPDHTGIPLHGNFYMLQIFYHNPSKADMEADSGFRIYHTNKLRRFDAGIFISGVISGETQIVPPKQNSFANVGICSIDCVSGDPKLFPDNGINIISVTGLTHATGTKISLSHIRNETEIDIIIDDNFHSIDYQESWQLGKERKIMHKDNLITKCSYNTQNRHFTTLGGYSAEDEMCLTFITYYPKIDLVGCYSMIPVVEFFKFFDVMSFYSLNMTVVENLILYGESYSDGTLTKNSKHIEKTFDDYSHHYNNSILSKLVIKEPTEFQDKTFIQHINKLPWDDETFSAKLERDMSTGSYQLSCRVSNISHHIPRVIVKFPHFKQREKETSMQCPNQFHLELTSSMSNTLQNSIFSLSTIAISSILSSQQLCLI